MKRFLVKTGAERGSGPSRGKRTVPAAGAVSVLILAGLLAGCPNEPAPAPLKTEAPGAAAAAVKTGPAQSAAVFTLAGARGGIWKVYGQESGGEEHPDVYAAYDAGTGKLTLISRDMSRDIAAGDYWVTVTESGKTESSRVRLTVKSQEASAEPRTAAPVTEKAEPAQTAVTFTLSNEPPYAAGTVWTVYAASSGGAAAEGVGAAHSGQALTMSHASDIPAGIYYVSARESGRTESGRLALAVRSQPVSDPPRAEAAERGRAKEQAVQQSVSFTLASVHSGVWKVYGEGEGGGPLADVSAAFSAPALTLAAAGSDLDAGVYYVSVTQTNKGESPRLALTVQEYANPDGTSAPAAENAARRTRYKSAKTAAAVSYTLINDTYNAGTVFTVYAAAEGAAPAPGVTARWDAGSKTLTLVHGSDIPVGVYYITAKNPGKSESERRAFTVKGRGAAQITVALPAVPGDPARISGGTAVSRSAGTLTVTAAGGDSVSAWRLDGVRQAGSGMSIVIDVSGLSAGRHHIAVIIYKDGVPYSKELAFTAEE